VAIDACSIFTPVQVITHSKYMKATAAEAEVALWDLQNESTISPWAFIPHEEKPGVFKFVWYAPSMQPEPGADLPP
jgi:hypothetical protein